MLFHFNGFCGYRSSITSTPNTSQSNKRTNSNHRRDKARDKTSYSQRDKASNITPTSLNNSNRYAIPHFFALTTKTPCKQTRTEKKYITTNRYTMHTNKQIHQIIFLIHRNGNSSANNSSLNSSDVHNNSTLNSDRAYCQGKLMFHELEHLLSIYCFFETKKLQ